VQDNPRIHEKHSNPDTGPDLGRAAAERGLLALLLQNPDYYGEIRSKLTEQDFAGSDHAAIYRVLCGLLGQNKLPDLTLMSPHLDRKQMGLASSLLATGREIKYFREQAEEFLTVMARQKERKSSDELGQMSPQQLQEYINAQRAAKL
jgi:replicative DNA helicase